jgi:hypothetical protein
MVDTISKILGIARRTYFHWQKDEDKCFAINLFNKYFTKEELEEFIETGKILRCDLAKDIPLEDLKNFDNLKHRLLVSAEIAKKKQEIKDLEDSLILKESK